MAKQKLTMQEQVDEILARAQEKGVSTNFFFVTTFERYRMQMKILEDLKKEINASGATVKKEYVKGRANVYTNPAITDYNKTATAANGTVATLMNIIKSLPEEEAQSDNLATIMEQLLNE